MELSLTTSLFWRSPEELVALGFARAPVVLMNEAHSGLARCVRTREVGRRILPAAHAAGVRHLAMETLHPSFTASANRERSVPPAERESYLGQPEMRELVQAALDLGWTLHCYEADLGRWLEERHGYTVQRGPEGDLILEVEWLERHGAELMSDAYTNWREEQQALSLLTVRTRIGPEAKLLVWCGNGHLLCAERDWWVPMGAQLMRRGCPLFAIDQTVTVAFEGLGSAWRAEMVERYAADLAAHGGTAGLVLAELPPDVELTRDVDAVILSVDNALVEG